MPSFQTLAFASVAAAAAGSCTPKNFQNLVTFGDSYTDGGRLAAVVAGKGTGPPPGTYIPDSNFTASGGYAWGHFASQALGAKNYNYASSGATCSNKQISRNFAAINAPFPDVLGYEIPAFLADVDFVNTTTGTNTLYTNRTSDNTVYALWIGTNDLGLDAFLTDSQTPGVTISDYVECIWEVFDNIYRVGGRNFVLFNQAPLQVSPLYAAVENAGVGNNKYWTDKTSYNTTEYQYKMWEYTTNVNTIFDYGVPFQLLVKSRWPGASFSVFNVHQLLTDIHDNPTQYLDAPANVTGWYQVCNPDRTGCTDSSNPLSSFLWYDELHPSERADKIIAAEFVNLLHGNSSYGLTY